MSPFPGGTAFHIGSWWGGGLPLCWQRVLLELVISMLNCCRPFAMTIPKHEVRERSGDQDECPGAGAREEQPLLSVRRPRACCSGAPRVPRKQRGCAGPCILTGFRPGLPSAPASFLPLFPAWTAPPMAGVFSSFGPDLHIKVVCLASQSGQVSHGIETAVSSVKEREGALYSTRLPSYSSEGHKADGSHWVKIQV